MQPSGWQHIFEGKAEVERTGCNASTARAMGKSVGTDLIVILTSIVNLIAR